MNKKNLKIKIDDLINEINNISDHSFDDVEFSFMAAFLIPFHNQERTLMRKDDNIIVEEKYGEGYLWLEQELLQFFKNKKLEKVIITN